MLVIGIDPGKKGGYAVICDNPKDPKLGKLFVETKPIPLIGKGKDATIDVLRMERQVKLWLNQLIDFGTEVYAVIEKVGAMPKQGVRSMFTFGRGYGKLLALLELTTYRKVEGNVDVEAHIPFSEVRPTTWKKDILRDTAKDKDAAIRHIRARYPDVSLLATPRSRVDHDGMAEALCLAEYARRNN